MSEQKKSKPVKEALDEVLSEMEAMSPEQLRDEIDKHKNGTVATALREAGEFLAKHTLEKNDGSKKS